MSKSHVGLVQKGKPARSPAGRTPGSRDESGGHRQDVVGTMRVTGAREKDTTYDNENTFFFEYFVMFYYLAKK